MDSIEGLALDGSGNLYVSQDNLAMVERVAPNGSITVVAGTGVAIYSGDGGPATQAGLNSPTTLAVDPTGNLLSTTAGCGWLTPAASSTRRRLCVRG